MTKLLESRPEAVIFDLDGTLLDTEPLYTRASQRVLDAFGETFDPALKRRTMGGDSRHSARMIIDHHGLPLSVDEYLEQREAYLEALFPEITEIEGAGEFIGALRHRGVATGLATSSNARLGALKLQGKPWARHFDAAVYGDDPRLRHPKPAPDIFLLCAQALNQRAEGCIVFEDSPNGITAALEAGMQVIAIDSPWVDADDLADASLIVSNYRELFRFMRDWD